MEYFFALFENNKVKVFPEIRENWTCNRSYMSSSANSVGFKLAHNINVCAYFEKLPTGKP